MPSIPTFSNDSLGKLRPIDGEASGTGVEWMVDAFGCEVDGLCDPRLIREICNDVIRDLNLNVVGDPQVHQFDEPGGVTALFMLSESHLACHTYPEFQSATFNLYCCRARPTWDWCGKLRQRLNAQHVGVQQIVRGLRSMKVASTRNIQAEQGDA